MYGHTWMYFQVHWASREPSLVFLGFFSFWMADTLGTVDLNTVLVKSLKFWGPQSEWEGIFASFVTSLSREPSLVSSLTRILTTGIAVQEQQQHVHDICDCQMCVLDTHKKHCFKLRFLRYFANFTYLAVQEVKEYPIWKNSSLREYSYASVNGCESATGSAIKYFHI